MIKNIGERVYIDLPDGSRRYVGTRRGTTLVRRLDFRKHLLRKENALGIDDRLLDRVDIEWIVVIDREKDPAYIVSRAVYRKEGVVMRYDGYEAQRFLPLRWWNKVALKDVWRHTLDKK